MRKGLKIKVPPGLEDFEQKGVAIAIGDSIFKLKKVGKKEKFLDLAKVYSLAGMSDLEARYLAVVKNAESIAQKVVQDFAARLPSFEMMYKHNIMVSVSKGDELQVILPFKLKIEYLEDFRILNKKIEHDVHLKFNLHIYRGYYSITSAQVVKWNTRTKRFEEFPHYHVMDEGYTCWGSLKMNRNIKNFADLLELRDRAQEALRSANEESDYREEDSAMPSWNSLRTGGKRKVLTASTVCDLQTKETKKGKL